LLALEMAGVEFLDDGRRPAETAKGEGQANMTKRRGVIGRSYSVSGWTISRLAP
jgi:hypothetical protein